MARAGELVVIQRGMKFKVMGFYKYVTALGADVMVHRSPSLMDHPEDVSSA